MKQGAVRKRGFTIIEVVLVLGIAGLIFMMVFIALPTLQRNSRDAQRRDDMLAFADALKKYQTNNRGALPATEDTLTAVVTSTVYTNTDIKPNTWAGFYRDYLPNPFKDPSGDTYGLATVNCKSNKIGEACTGVASNVVNNLSSDTSHSIYVIVQAGCDGERVVGVANPRKVAILYKLEGGGVYCGEA